MAYDIKKTDGSTLVVIPNNTVVPPGTVLDLTLYGKGKLDYGKRWNENFVHLTENFANTTEPASPIEGQLWFDQSGNELKVRVGAAWSTLVTSGAGASTFVNVVGDAMTGDLDMTGNDILNVGNLGVGTINGFSISSHASRHEAGGSDQVDHNNLTGYVLQEHIDHTSVSITGGTGLSGGGTIDTSQALNLDIPSLSADSAPTSTDYIVTYDGSSHRKVTLSDAVGAGAGGSVHAFAVFNGISMITVSSRNVSSIVRNGTGDYTVSFSNAGTIPAVAVMRTSNFNCPLAPRIISLSATSVRFIIRVWDCQNSGGTRQSNDETTISVSIMV